ncbi:methyl-CPG-binding domain 7 protein, partial [Prunus dulcis]
VPQQPELDEESWGKNSASNLGGLDGANGEQSDSAVTMKRKKKGKSSQSSKPIPLLTLRAAKKEEEPSSRSESQLQLVTTTTAPFRLPDDWSVEEKRRPLRNTSSPSRIDKYYIEPGTGLKFRSLPSVQRYLTEGQIETHMKKLKPGSECNMQIIPGTTCTSSFILPDDWEIEKKQRKNSRVIDKTYIEPGTGQRFRSLRAVERYLTEGNENTPLKLSLCSGDQKIKSLPEVQSQKVVSTPLDINISGESDRPSKLNLGRPPVKVNWVLAGRGGNMWNPFMDDSEVSGCVKRKWFETFKSSMYGGNISPPSHKC